MRKFDKKQRNTHKRNPKPVIAIVTEGENVTETQYFKKRVITKNGKITELTPGQRILKSFRFLFIKRNIIPKSDALLSVRGIFYQIE